MEKLKYYLPSIIFNVAEISVILLAGKLLGLTLGIMLLILAVFVMIRMTVGKAMHYKSPYKCAIWSLLVFLSLFVLTNVGLGVSIIMSVFCAFILTTKGDINDAFMWKGRETKYSDIDEYIKYNSMETRLIEYENKLKNQDNLTYLIYKYRFRDKMTFSQIGERLDLENPRIAEKLDQIAFSFRIYFGI
jgi:hypothetical protein